MKGSEPDDELVIKSIYQAISTYIAGLPIIKDIVESTSREALGMDVYDDVSPITEGLDKGLREGIKAIRGDKSKTVTRKDHAIRSIQYLLEAYGVPAKNITKQFNRWFKKEEVYQETRLKEADDKLKALKDSKNNFEARMAKDIKQAYSTAKSTATRLRNEGKVLQADMIDELIEDSKMRLRDGNYKNLGVELRMFEARLETID
jgi:hypothetical protein